MPDPADPAAFGPLLQARRQAAGLSLGALAARAGVSKGALSKIERGAMSPTYETLRKLADGFEISLASLVAPPAPEAPIPSAEAPPLPYQRLPAARIPADPAAYTHLLLADPEAELSFTPALTTLHAETREREWDSHDTADFLYCLEGRAEMRFRDHPSVTLEPGEAMTMDGRAPHAALRIGPAPARLLWISAPRRSVSGD